MVPLVAAGLISGAASILGSVFGGLFGKSSQNSANKANMELAKYKYEKDLEMWNRQNDYNTPAAQMSRYAQAGLNPNLVYDQGNNGNASSAPSFDVPEMKAYTDYGDLGFGRAAGNVLQSYQLANQKESIDNLKELQDSQKGKNDAEAAGQLLKNEEQLYHNAKAAKEAGLYDKYAEEQILSGLDTQRKQRENLDSQIEQRKHQNDLADSQRDVNIQQLDNLKQNIRESLSRMGVNSARIREIQQNTERLAFETAKLSEEERRIMWENASRPDYEKQKIYNERMLEIDADLKALKFDIENATHGQSQVWNMAASGLLRFGTYGLSMPGSKLNRK